MKYHPISSDPRYTVQREFCGYKETRYVARFCDEWIGQSISYPSAVLRCAGHKAERNGAPVIVCQPVEQHT